MRTSTASIESAPADKALCDACGGAAATTADPTGGEMALCAQCAFRMAEQYSEPTEVVIPGRFLGTFKDAAWTCVAEQAAALAEAARDADDRGRRWAIDALTAQLGIAQDTDRWLDRSPGVNEQIGFTGWWTCMCATVERSIDLSSETIAYEAGERGSREIPTLRDALDTIEVFRAIHDDIERPEPRA